jgi:hypothetical protein
MGREDGGGAVAVAVTVAATGAADRVVVVVELVAVAEASRVVLLVDIGTKLKK